VSYDPALLVPKKSSREEALAVLRHALDALEELEPFDEAALDAAISGLVERLGLNRGTAFMSLRVATTGRTAAPGLFETMAVLGREKVSARLRRAIETLG
jgi:glutamyl-tRNA synthetase